MKMEYYLIVDEVSTWQCLQLEKINLLKTGDLLIFVGKGKEMVLCRKIFAENTLSNEGQ
jgi:hypothetical protein